MTDFLKGKKTYFVAAGMIIYAALGYLLGYHSADDATRLGLQAAGLVGLRAGIAKVAEPKKGE